MDPAEKVPPHHVCLPQVLRCRIDPHDSCNMKRAARWICHPLDTIHRSTACFDGQYPVSALQACHGWRTCAIFLYSRGPLRDSLIRPDSEFRILQAANWCGHTSPPPSVAIRQRSWSLFRVPCCTASTAVSSRVAVQACRILAIQFWTWKA